MSDGRCTYPGGDIANYNKENRSLTSIDIYGVKGFACSAGYEKVLE